MSFTETLQSDFRNLDLLVSSESLQRLSGYAEEIEHWNKAVNLTALHGASLVRRLIVEPVWVGKQLQMSGTVSDVGSGNGSPGIPLSITRTFSMTSLIEPRLKRAAFLRHVVAKLGLTGIVIHRCRVEEMPRPDVCSDWIVLQALDPTPEVVRSLRQISHETTRVVWITSRERPPAPRAEKLELPDSRTKIWVFRLDQT